MADEPKPGTDLTRRDAIKLGTVATIGATLAVSGACAPAPTPGTQTATTFFTPDELALVDELSELIIPTDNHSPGARAAKVASYIDARLAEAWEEADRTGWRDGLGRVNQLSQQMHGKPFLQGAAADRVAVLTRMARNERSPQTLEEKFFVELKARVVQAYYSSEIGIKQEMEYRGNVFLDEFVGVDVT